MQKFRTRRQGRSWKERAINKMRKIKQKESWQKINTCTLTVKYTGRPVGAEGAGSVMFPENQVGRSGVLPALQNVQAKGQEATGRGPLSWDLIIELWGRSRYRHQAPDSKVNVICEEDKQHSALASHPPKDLISVGSEAFLTLGVGQMVSRSNYVLKSLGLSLGRCPQ